MGVTGLDHLVIYSTDQERALDWYTNVLGLAEERGQEWRQGEAPFPSVRVNENTIIDLFAGPTSGLDHFCLVMDHASWEEMAAGVVPVDRGPTQVFGARGVGESIYTHDPDGNVVELRHY